MAKVTSLSNITNFITKKIKCEIKMRVLCNFHKETKFPFTFQTHDTNKISVKIECYRHQKTLAKTTCNFTHIQHLYAITTQIKKHLENLGNFRIKIMEKVNKNLS